MSITAIGERSVSVTMRVKRGGKWTRLQAAYGRNGRIRPGYAKADGEQIASENAVYEIRSYENRQAKYKTVGRNAADAEAERLKVEKQFRAHAVADDAGLKIEKQEAERKTIRKSADEYIADCEDRGAKEAALKSRYVCDEFIQVTKLQYMDEIKRKDVLAFHKALRKRGCEDRTVADKHNRVKSWLIFAELEHEDILPPTPKFDKKLPTVYAKDEISSPFRHRRKGTSCIPDSAQVRLARSGACPSGIPGHRRGSWNASCEVQA